VYSSYREESALETTNEKVWLRTTRRNKKKGNRAALDIIFVYKYAAPVYTNLNIGVQNIQKTKTRKTKKDCV
jgi:hypothetical protein